MVGITILAAVWGLIGPARLGGEVTPLVVSGTSMQPALEDGDLVLLRREERYEVGDIVAFVDPVLNDNITVHRVIAERDGYYQTQGDNRGTGDLHNPTSDEIIGRAWRRAPGLAGAAIELTRARSIFLLLVAGMAVGFASTGAAPSEGERPRLPSRGRHAVRETLSRYSPVGLQLAIFGALVLLAGIAVATAPLWRGTTEASFVSASYSVDSQLTYGGLVTVDGLYDDNLLAPPAPVYRSVTTHLPLRFRTEIASPSEEHAVDAVLGTHRITAVVAQGADWSRTLELASATGFVESGAVTNTSLNLDLVDGLIAEFEAASGASGRYIFTITGESTVSARIRGEPIEGATESVLEFAIDDERLTFQGGVERLGGSAAGTIREPIEVPRQAAVPLFGDTPIENLVPVGIGGAVVGGVVLLAVAIATFRTRRDRPGGPIRARLGRLLARTETAPRLPLRIVEVEGIEDLTAVAEQRAGMVLELSSRHSLEYVVIDGDTAYRFTPAG